MAQVIKDFILQLGFDSKAVEKGLKDIEARMASIAQVAGKHQRQQTSDDEKASAKRTANASKEAKEAERIAIRRNRLMTTLMISERRAESRMGGSGNPETERKLDTLINKMNQLREAASKASTAGNFSRITNEIRLNNQQLDFAIQKHNKLTRSLTAQKFAANAARDSARNLARSYLSVFAAVGLINNAGKTGMEFESIRASMLAASGSSKQAAIDFQFVQDSAMALGRDVKSSARGFQQLAVAASDAGMTMAQTKEMFLAGSEAATAFGLTSEDTFGVFRAFTQIISKGTVSSEELKQQLGDRLPIAMSTAARAMGVTVTEMTKLLENGEVISKDFLPKFSKELRAAARNGGALTESLKTSRVALQRLKNTYDINIDKAFREGVGEGLTDFLTNMTRLAENAAPTFRTLGRIIGGAMKVIGLASRALFQVLRPMAVILDQITGAFSGVDDKTKDAAKGVNALTLALTPFKRALHLLAAIVLLPFALIELGMDTIEGMSDGFLKTMAAIGMSLAIFLAAGKGKEMFKNSGKSAGSLFGAAFRNAFLLTFAFGLGKEIGDLINDSLNESEDGGSGFSNGLGNVVDRVLSATGNEAATARLATNEDDSTVGSRWSDFGSGLLNSISNFGSGSGPTMGSSRMVRSAQAQKDKVAQSNVAYININASNLSPEAIAMAIDVQMQNTFKVGITEG